MALLHRLARGRLQRQQALDGVEGAMPCRRNLPVSARRQFVRPRSASRVWPRGVSQLVKQLWRLAMREASHEDSR